MTQCKKRDNVPTKPELQILRQWNGPPDWSTNVSSKEGKGDPRLNTSRIQKKNKLS